MLYENEVEWFDSLQDDLESFRQSCFTDEKFRAFMEENGASDCLYFATTLHREVSDQLKVQNEYDTVEEFKDWRRKAVRVVTSVKKRRQQLRRIVKDLYGQEAVDEINKRVQEESEDVA